MQRSTSISLFDRAVPQYISGRTSYLHVRLAFHPYPPLIPQFCNTGGFEPRRTFTSASLWPWIAHVVSGRISTTFRPLQTRFPSGSPPLSEVNHAMPMHSPDHSTKGTPLALRSVPRRSSPFGLAPRSTAQWPLTASTYTVSGPLSSTSRGAFHLSLTVLVPYRWLEVFSLGGWSPLLPTGFLVPRGTQDPVQHSLASRYGTLTRSGGLFHALRVRLLALPLTAPTTPDPP